MPLPGLFDDKAGSALVERITRCVLRAVIRSVVFIAGMVAGFGLGLVVLSFGGSATADFMGVFFGFGLMLAAPLCWIAAVRGKKRDSWTVGYVVAWFIFIVVFYGLGFIERGKPVVTSDYATDVAFALLGVVYLVVLPIGAVLYRRRTRSD